MLTLAFDSETTGVPARGARTEDASYPRIVQLAAVLYRDGDEVASFDLIVRPDGWGVPPEAARVHGITTEVAARVGVPVRVALAALTNLARAADERWAHNAEFDVGIVRSELHRCGADPLAAFAGPFRCTADESTGWMAIPPTERMIAAGFVGPKRPSLAELFDRLFGGGFDGAHSALADARAAARCLFELRRLGVVA